MSILVTFVSTLLTLPFIYIEALMVVGVLIVAVDFPGIVPRSPRLEVMVTNMARRPAFSAWSFCGIALLLRLALLPLIPVPQPRVHDEFSHLLAADTFASGRVTNPTHPMWEHFETFHVNQWPTYMSMYPPAQGLVLSAGQLLGHPWIGVLLSTGLMCSALTWMFYGWLPPLWAFLGGLLTVLRFSLLSYWINSYWGGGVAAIGGALVLGALPRLKKSPKTSTALLMAMGMSILANSRPYEGLLLVIPVTIILLAHLRRQWADGRRQSVLKVILPIIIVGIFTTAAMGLYFWRVTGDPLLMPYVLNQATYGVNNPLTAMFKARIEEAAPSYRHDEIRGYYARDLMAFQQPVRQPGLLGTFVNAGIRVGIEWAFYLGPLFTLPLLIGWRALLDRRFRPLLWIGLFSAIGLSFQAWSLPHYLAPLTGLILAFVVQGMRHSRLWRRSDSRTGFALIAATPLICILMLVIATVGKQWNPLFFGQWPIAWCCASPGNLERAQIVGRLSRLPDRHLVLVQYGLNHDTDDEWVYNAADIDRAKIVWARSMGAESDATIIRYFSDRRLWILLPDETPVKLTESLASPP